MEALISICSCKIHLPNSSTSTRIIAKNINVKFYYIRKGFIIWMQYSMTKASEITVTISRTCSPELSHDLHKLLDRTDSHFNFKFINDQPIFHYWNFSCHLCNYWDIHNGFAPIKLWYLSHLRYLITILNTYYRTIIVL